MWRGRWICKVIFYYEITVLTIKQIYFKRNILKIESESEIKEFIGSLLDTTIPANKKFLNELLNKLKRPSEFSDVTVYVKPKITEAASSKFKQNKNQTVSNKVETDNKSHIEVTQPLKKNGVYIFHQKKNIL